MMRLLLVEDHAPVRRALRDGLEATGEAQVIAEAATAHEAIAVAEANGEVEVALMDVELRDPDVGVDALGVALAVALCWLWYRGNRTLTEELARLTSLRERGALTEGEFQRAKERVLGG